MPGFNTSHAVSADAAALLEILIAKAFEALAELPAHQGREVSAAGRRATLSTYRDTMPNGTVRVVVQTYETRWFGVTALVQAAGFSVAPDGSRTVLPDESVYDFT